MADAVPDYIAQRIRQNPPEDCLVIPGSTPVLSFGNPRIAWLATVGSNPGRSAFLLNGQLTSEYFETLQSLKITQLTDASVEHVARVYARCTEYFKLPRHRQWFDPQKTIVRALGGSYEDGSACHLDVVQWSTNANWTQLQKHQRKTLLSKDGAFLKLQLEMHSTIRLILLNGDAVMSDFLSTLRPDGHWLNDPLAYKYGAVHFWLGRLTFPTHEIAILGWDKNFQGAYGMDDLTRKSILDRISAIWAGQSDPTQTSDK